MTRLATRLGLSFDWRALTVSRGGVCLATTRTAMMFVEALAEAGAPLCERDIALRVYGRHQRGSNVVNVTIYRLRAALKPLGLTIVNERGVGFSLAVRS